MFPDSKITKNSCGRTKTTNVLSGAVAKESFSRRKSSDLYKWFGFATGGTSDENDKFLPMLIRHFASNGLYWTCLILTRSLNCRSCFKHSSLMRASLSWETCCTYTSNNTSSMTGKNKSLLKLIKDTQSQLPQKDFDVDCPCHLAHFCALKGSKALSMEIDNFGIDLFHHFKRSVKRKATLSDYMEFTNTEVKKIIKHVTTLWLSLGKSLDRTLLQWDALESYFLCEFEDNDEKTKYDDKVTREVRLVRKFNDPFTKLYVLFVQSIMPSLHTYNTFLQSEEPLVHLLQDTTWNLYKALLSRFIKPDVIAQNDDILCIDIGFHKLQRIFIYTHWIFHKAVCIL